MRKAINRVRLQSIWDYLIWHAWSHNGNSPTYRVISLRTGIKSTSMISYYLDWLEDHGKITREDGVIIILDSRWIPPKDLTIP
jgi:hypothetical protein